MNRRFSPEHAERLVPILRSIACEIGERTRAIEQLESTLESAATLPRGTDIRGIQAALAHQRRELRFAKRELARLGCAVDDDHPLRILVPGADGTFAGGYSWNPGEDVLRSNELRMAG
jgi:hypothetical protein